jgi:hypothetical protein
MELSYIKQSTPTFPQWLKVVENKTEHKFEIERVFCNKDWKTITFCTSEFRVNFKFTTKLDYEATEKQVRSNLTKPCKALIFVDYENEGCQLKLSKASDADEDAAIFKEDDFGFIRTNPAKP